MGWGDKVLKGFRWRGEEKGKGGLPAKAANREIDSRRVNKEAIGDERTLIKAKTWICSLGEKSRLRRPWKGKIEKTYDLAKLWF